MRPGSLKELYGIASGQQRTAPAHVLWRLEEWQLLEKVNERFNGAYTLEDLRRMKAGDLAFLQQYLVMTAPKIEEKAHG